MASGEAAVKLKRALRTMKPAELEALQPALDAIDASLEHERLMENAIPLESCSCREYALNEIHDLKPEEIRTKARDLGIEESRALILARRNQLARTLSLFLQNLHDSVPENLSKRVSCYISELMLIVTLCDDCPSGGPLRECMEEALGMITEAAYSMAPILKLRHLQSRIQE